MLELDLIPHTCWHSNLRTILTPESWRTIRAKTLDAAEHACELCGAEAEPDRPLECHEKWFFDHEALSQRLERLMCLCKSCHTVKHWGRSKKHNPHDALFIHLLEVNGWGVEQAQAHIRDAYAKVVAYGSTPWTIDISYLDREGLDYTIPEEPSVPQPSQPERASAVMPRKRERTEPKLKDLPSYTPPKKRRNLRLWAALIIAGTGSSFLMSRLGFGVSAVFLYGLIWVGLLGLLWRKSS